MFIEASKTSPICYQEIPRKIEQLEMTNIFYSINPSNSSTFTLFCSILSLCLIVTVPSSILC